MSLKMRLPPDTGSGCSSSERLSFGEFVADEYSCAGELLHDFTRQSFVGSVLVYPYLFDVESS